MRCTMGTSPARLTVLPIRTVFLTGQPQANISDHKSMVNLAPFGLCRSLGYPATASATAAHHGHLTPMPCMHNTPMPWMNGKMDYLIKGQPALLKSCKCQCMWGGTISLVTDGQVGEGVQWVQKKPEESFEKINYNQANTSENSAILESEGSAPTKLESENVVSVNNVSNEGIELIKKFEGCRLNAYQDSVGVWTVGYGTTSADKTITSTDIKKGVTITQQQADEWLMKSLNNKYASKVSKYDSIYHWTQNEFDALVSFAYNIGSIDQLVANGTRSKQEIADKMLKYVYAGGKVLPGLERRRQAEHDLFLP